MGEISERVSFVVNYSAYNPCSNFFGEAAKLMLKCFGFEITSSNHEDEQESPDPSSPPDEPQVKAFEDAVARISRSPVRPPPNTGRGGQTN